MGREASTAPKERINVTFKPAPGNAQEEIELPLKATVVGDFWQRHDPRLLQDRKPVNISKNNFADVMEKQNLGLQFAVPRKLQDGESDVDMHVDLAFASMRDFEPGSIIEQIPELAQLNRLRQALVSLKGPLGNLPAFRKVLEDIHKNPERREAILREVGELGLNPGSASDATPGGAAESEGGADESKGSAAGPSKKGKK